MTDAPSIATAPPEWRTAPGLTPYPDAIATMQQRVAAIRAGTATELVWLVEHPPLYTAGTSARPEELTDPTRFPTFNAGRGGQWTYHGPGQRTAYVMLDLTRPHGTVPARDVRCYVHGLEEWLIRALARFGVRGERRDGRIGIWVADPATGTEAKIARHRRARHPLGKLARRRAERRPGPRPLHRHRALRHQRARRHQPARARRSRHDGGGRRGPARRMGRGVRLMLTARSATEAPPTPMDTEARGQARR